MTYKSYKVKEIRLEVSGVEKTVVDYNTSKRSSALHSGRYIGESTESEVNSSDTFYHEDLSSFLKSIDESRDSSNNNDILFLDDGTIEIPAGLRKEFSFQFAIPKNGLESYTGQNVSIEYKVKAVIVRSWNKDIISERPFIVLNPYTKNVSNEKKYNNKYTKASSINIIGSGNDAMDRYNLTTNQKEEEEERDREEENEQQMPKLETNKKIFSPGDIIKGSLHLYLQHHDVNSIEISLNAIECATTKRYKEKSNWMAKFDEWWTGTNMQETSFEKYYQKFKLNNKDNTGQTFFPFGIGIPKDVKKSYSGKLSKYYWEIDAKLDIPMGSDKHISSVIEVV
jgi:hypothetical protein